MVVAHLQIYEDTLARCILHTRPPENFFFEHFLTPPGALAEQELSIMRAIYSETTVSINVRLQQFGGDELARDVQASPMMEIGELKDIAAELIGATGFGVLSVALVAEGERLRDVMESLVDCNIQDGTTITIVQVGSFRDEDEYSWFLAG